MLPDDFSKSKSSAFSVFLWKKKGWVTLTSFITLVFHSICSLCYVNSTNHTYKKCFAAFTSGVNRVRPEITAGGYNQVVWLWLTSVVPWSSENFQWNHCTAAASRALVVSSTDTSAIAATDDWKLSKSTLLSRHQTQRVRLHFVVQINASDLAGGQIPEIWRLNKSVYKVYLTTSNQFTFALPKQWCV